MNFDKNNHLYVLTNCNVNIIIKFWNIPFNQILYSFPNIVISDLSIFNNCRAMCIFDRMNSLKTLIDRDVLTSWRKRPLKGSKKGLFNYERIVS